ncbi:MAG: hypothetical protein J5517_05355 [Eubacterium sp.]|nr:hypothetical protein [Eubacterium sp.]
MRDKYNESFEKIKMDSGRKDEIRNMITESSVTPKKKTGYIGLLVAAAAIIAVLAVPPSREAVFAAARYIRNKFTTANGSTVEISSQDLDGGTSMIKEISVSTSVGEAKDIVKVEDGKILFVADGKNKDITNKISEDKYYKYEKEIEDGQRSALYVGGTPDNAKWIEVIYDKNGSILMQTMSLSEQEVKNTEWAKKALKDAGSDEGSIILIMNDDGTIIAGEITTSDSDTSVETSTETSTD